MPGRPVVFFSVALEARLEARLASQRGPRSAATCDDVVDDDEDANLKAVESTWTLKREFKIGRSSLQCQFQCVLIVFKREFRN